MKRQIITIPTDGTWREGFLNSTVLYDYYNQIFTIIDNNINPVSKNQNGGSSDE